MKDRPLTDFDRTVLGQMEQIRAIGRKRLRNQNELDDFVQETIARAYANRSRLRDPAKLKQWIAGVARNTANEWNRAFDRMKREQPLQDEIGIQDEIDPLDALEQVKRPRRGCSRRSRSRTPSCRNGMGFPTRRSGYGCTAPNGA